MHRTAYYLFLSSLIFAPLAFGTVETWACTIMELLICVSALFLYLSHRQKSFYKTPGIIPLLLVGALIAFQVIPLPSGLVRLISPESHEIYLSTVGVVTPAHWMTISIYPGATLAGFLRFSSYILFYVIAVQFLSNAALLKNNLSVIAIFGGLLAFFVIIEFFTKILGYPLPHDKILWIRDSAHGAGSIGPYVNRNHYAGFAEMIFPLVLSLFLIYRPITTRVGLKKRFADFFLQNRIHLHFLYGTAAVLIATSLFITLSRGGIISLTLAIGLLAVFLIQKTRQKATGWGIAIIFVLVLSLAGTDAWDMVLERFGNIRDESGQFNTGRPVYWNDSVEIFRDFPLLGAGMGTFEHVYPKYRTFPGTARLEHAHNDYLEFLSTGGIIISSLMLCAMIVILHKSLQSWKKRREWHAIYLFAGCLAAIFSILLHSFVDFNMQIGANGLYFFFLLAMTVSAANTRFRSGRQSTYLQFSTVKFYIPLLAALCLMMGVLYVNFGALLGNLHSSRYQDLDLSIEPSDENLRMAHQSLQAAAKSDFLNPSHYHILANISAVSGQADSAMAYYIKALRLAPLNSQYLGDTAFFMSNRRETEAADHLLRVSIEYNRNDVSNYLNYASWLFGENRVEEGTNILRSAMAMDPAATDACLALMAWYGLDENRMKQALPDRVTPHLQFADYLLSKGSYEKAETAYLEALSYLPHENAIKKDFFLRAYRVFWGKKEYETALQIIRHAIIYFPDDPQLHLLAGNLYKVQD